MHPIRIFIVDDHKLITDAWTEMLNADSRFQVIGVTNNSAHALSLIKDKTPDIVMLDISMEPVDGYTLTKEIISFSNTTKVIAVSYYDMPACCSRIMEAGASGYVTKTSSGEELVEAIIEVFSGKRYTCPEINQNIIQEMIQPDEMTHAIRSLTAKQLSIIGYLKKGFSSKEIAGFLGVTNRTVEIHRYNIMKKLGLKNIAALINEVNMRGI